MSASKSSSSSGRSRSRKTSARRSSGGSKQVAGTADGLAGVVEQLVNRILRPLDMVMISRERIQQTLDEAAERGRMTRTDANEVVVELIRRGRQQTDELLSDFERLMVAVRRGSTPPAGARASPSRWISLCALPTVLAIRSAPGRRCRSRATTR